MDIKQVFNNNGIAEADLKDCKVEIVASDQSIAEAIQTRFQEAGIEDIQAKYPKDIPSVDEGGIETPVSVEEELPKIEEELPKIEEEIPEIEERKPESEERELSKAEAEKRAKAEAKEQKKLAKVTPKKIFRKYRRKMAREGVLRALLWALVGGAAAAVVVAFVCWMIGYTGYHALIAGTGVFAASILLVTPILFFVCYRPTEQEIARRLDREMDLKERTVTMLEYKQSEDSLAEIQRKDAAVHLKGVWRRKLKFPFSKKRGIALLVTCVLLLAMLPVAVLAEFVPALRSPLVKEWERIPSYEIEYTMIANGGGETIEGRTLQSVERGQTGDWVRAVPEEGFYFLGWSDGNLSPVRRDISVEGHSVYFAYFAPVLDGFEPTDAEDAPDDVPADEGNNDGPSRPGDPSDNPTGGGQYRPNDYIVDGETYYRDIFEEYYEQAMAMLQAGEELPAELRAFLEAYYNILK